MSKNEETKSSQEMTKEQAFIKEYADIFIAALKEEKLPWNKGFMAFNPSNVVSGKDYSGFNFHTLKLSAQIQEFSDTRWMTFNQAKLLDGHVKKGSTGTRVLYFGDIEVEKLDKDKKPVLDDAGDPIMEKRKFLKSYVVFNIEQIEGINLPPLDEQKKDQLNKVNDLGDERFNLFLEATKADIQYTRNIESCNYSPSKDKIRMIPRSDFQSDEIFKSTLLHELGHWTGHSSRLNRPLDNSLSASYAKEELVAEISAAMMKDRFGLYPETRGVSDNNKAYIQSWIKVLKEDPKEIMYATSKAFKVYEYLKGFDPVKDIKQEPIASKDELQKGNVTQEQVSKKISSLVETKTVEKVSKAKEIIESKSKEKEPKKAKAPKEKLRQRKVERQR